MVKLKKQRISVVLVLCLLMVLMALLKLASCGITKIFYDSILRFATYNSRLNIWNRVQKSSKTGQD